MAVTVKVMVQADTREEADAAMRRISAEWGLVVRMSPRKLPGRRRGQPDWCAMLADTSIAAGLATQILSE